MNSQLWFTSTVSAGSNESNARTCVSITPVPMVVVYDGEDIGEEIGDWQDLGQTSRAIPHPSISVEDTDVVLLCCVYQSGTKS